MEGDQEAGMTPVSLNVYDLSQGLARQLSAAFLGTSIDAIYHTGVVVYGNEYWFGNGIEQGSPGRTYFGPPLRTLKLGNTAIPKEVFVEFLQGIRDQFNPSTYSLLRNNCNHFSNEVSQFLVGSGIPKAIVELPDVVLNSPQGPLIASMLRGMENSLRNGQAAGFPLAGGFQASQSASVESFAPAAHSVHMAATPGPGPIVSEGQELQADRKNEIQFQSSASKDKANTPLANAGASASRAAALRLEEEIKREFTILMALGHIGANEAAAEALRRVKAREGNVKAS